MASATSSGTRLEGLDVARGLAILGMVLVHFGLVLQPAATSFAFLGQLDGRPTMLFMLLAGIGITLMARSRSGADLTPLCARRGLFLLVIGIANLVLWPGDILRIYGVIFLLAGWLAVAPASRLVAGTTAFIGGFMILLFTLDYGMNWDWETLTYRNLWTLQGALRNLTVDGFRSVFPWAGVVIVGMLLGRLSLRDPVVQRRLVLVGATMWLGAEIVSRVALRALLSAPEIAEDAAAREDVVALLGTASIPPQVVFLTAAGGLATAIIGACCMVVRRAGLVGPLRALAATGQMAFTWYLGHVYLGVLILYAAGITTPSPGLAMTVGTAYFVLIAAISRAWRGGGRRGPMESLLRRVCG